MRRKILCGLLVLLLLFVAAFRVDYAVNKPWTDFVIVSARRGWTDWTLQFHRSLGAGAFGRETVFAVAVVRPAVDLELHIGPSHLAVIAVWQDGRRRWWYKKII